MWKHLWKACAGTVGCTHYRGQASWISRGVMLHKRVKQSCSEWSWHLLRWDWFLQHLAESLSTFQWPARLPASLSPSLSLTHTSSWSSLTGTETPRSDIPTSEKGVFNWMLNITSCIHKNIYKESLAVFTLSDGYDGMGLSIFTWKTLLMSNWCSVLERNKMVQRASLKNPSQSLCIITLFT